MTNDEQLIHRLYDGFNRRDIEAVLGAMADDVAWANGMEGTHVHGRDAVRAYWTYQWSVIDPTVTPLSTVTAADGAVVVEVHQLVRDLEGNVLLDEPVTHAFHLRDGLVARFDILGPSRLKDLAH
ncbi:nuclear transport factor 2 family protein [Luteibacter aegosomatissinici]|uniref:nuclear transport factor 2 family protein n=1 Tax=Luteibacter aegosomatissinici TaxID=2911539 RepID=UPI001FF8B28C|nr:nuclear transport factor 2 family protein [Luteibacter aegosomatissinici]UPG93003.1 nuclear transport factor 2 family protein [Luteibacter aegosomatissinici]